MYFKVLKIQEQGKLKISTREETINTKAEITKTEGKISRQRESLEQRVGSMKN